MPLTKEDLQAISQLMDEKITPIQSDIQEMKSDIIELKESVTEIRDSTNYMADWIQSLEDSFNNHRIKTKEP